MAQYKIERWDVILANDKRTPIVYIKPDLAFIELINKYKGKIICKIQDTQTNYDNNEIGGLAYQSAFIPNCRPNFYEKNGYYVIILESCWLGYPSPDKLGYVYIYPYSYIL